MFLCPGFHAPAGTWKSWNVKMLETAAASSNVYITRLSAVADGASNNVHLTVATVVSIVIPRTMQE